MSKPSDGMELDELRDEFDWMFEFQSHIAEQIRGDADVHNLVDYVGNLEAERDQLRQQLADVTESVGRLEERCAKLRELAKKLKACNSSCGRCIELYGICEHETELRELRVEVNV